jgi:phage recombination protein Bet
MNTQVAKFEPPRLPYHPAIEERFGVSASEWKALVEAVFPAAKTSDAVVMALSYCKARNLDPFKKVVHIVPVWDSQKRGMVETVWPGIAELRTTAFRTGHYAGRDPASTGETIKQQVGAITLEYPEWCQITVYRLVGGVRCAFPGPRVYWTEAYASQKRDDPTPNSMWRGRPFGQLEKCAEAAALRAAFPEELGGEISAEEMAGQTLSADESGTYRPTEPAPPRPERKDYAATTAPEVDETTMDAEYRAAMGEVVVDENDPAITGEIIEDEPETETGTESPPAPVKGAKDGDGGETAGKVSIPHADPVQPGPQGGIPPVPDKGRGKWLNAAVAYVEKCEHETELLDLLDRPDLDSLEDADRNAIGSAINARIEAITG